MFQKKKSLTVRNGEHTFVLFLNSVSIYLEILLILLIMAKALFVLFIFYNVYSVL